MFNSKDVEQIHQKAKSLSVQPPAQGKLIIPTPGETFELELPTNVGGIFMAAIEQIIKQSTR